jgi:hypothetical protein
MLFMKLWILALALLLVSPVFADLDANAAISPRYVDTNVINQTFVYTIIPQNSESINRTVIYAPAGYEITGIQSVKLNSTSCLGVGCVGEFNSSEIAVNFTTVDPINNATNININITFTANTSSSVIGNFTSIVSNTVFENSTTPGGVNYMQVVTQQMINVTTIAMSSAVLPACPTCKGTAVINGSDYWEFRFALGFNAAQAGLVQFRMNNWTDAVGHDLALYSGSTYYATLRNESNFNTTSRFNVNTAYVNNWGINTTNIPLPYYHLYLRMVIPAGTPSSSTWSTAYNFMFRATP